MLQFSSEAEDFVGSLSQSGTFAADPQGSGRAGGCSFLRSDGRGLVTGMEEMVAGEIWMIARSISYFFFFPLSSWDSTFYFYSIQSSLC